MLKKRNKNEEEAKRQEEANREANQLFEQVDQLVSKNQFEPAQKTLREALALMPDLDVADTWNNICRQGSLNNQAAEVLAACDEAVRLSPYWQYIDSRGLARALTSNMQGAIEDFQTVVELASQEAANAAEYDVDYSTYLTGIVEKRQHWLDELKAGRNPFTAEVLEDLRSE
ncbi:MAG: hypothetical protein KME47_23405 [Nodosilinea sp. WJT8-NPBG4]|nr:hypothetical protein [Nodosilinea sp. WJT8-NPBG4]